MKKTGIRKWIVHKLGGIMKDEQLPGIGGHTLFKTVYHCRPQLVAAENLYHYDAGDEGTKEAIKKYAEAQAVKKIIDELRSRGMIKFRHEDSREGLDERYKAACVRAEISVAEMEEGMEGES